MSAIAVLPNCGVLLELGLGYPFIGYRLESNRFETSIEILQVDEEQQQSGSRLAAILALEGMDGVGRVTARKILDQFGSLAAIRRFPREQILNRLRRVQHAAQLVDRLLDEPFVDEALAGAEKLIEELAKRQVVVVTSDDDAWPDEFEKLPASHRPNALYTYGNLKLLAEPSVAVLGTAPVNESPFEATQALVRKLAGAGTIVSCSATDGLDTVLIKILLSNDSLPLIIADCGLAKVAPGLRASVSAAVKAGGLLAGSFPMTHGPFDHDVRERALVQAAVAKATVFVEPRKDGFLWDALEWSLDEDKPVFALSSHPLPDRVHVIRDELDMDWVLAAIKHVPE